MFLEQKNRYNRNKLSIFVYFSTVEKQTKIEKTFYFCLLFYCRKIKFYRAMFLEQKNRQKQKKLSIFVYFSIVEKQNSTDRCSWNRKIDKNRNNFLFLSIFLLQKNRNSVSRIFYFSLYSILLNMHLYGWMSGYHGPWGNYMGSIV